MSVSEATVAKEAVLSYSGEPSPFRWSRGEYYQMAELGWFHGMRVELIEGEVMVLSPQNWLHASTTDRAGDVLRRAFGRSYWVRTQLPLSLGAASEPEPDVSVVAGSRDDYGDHPARALLAVEVSDTTLRYDRVRKASLYARAGIADFWIINLVDRQVEVHRNPVADDSQPYGFRYADVTVFSPGDIQSPLALPEARVTVADLLP